MAILLRPRFVYNDGSAVDYSMTISQRPWDYGSKGLGGSDTAASGVPAAFEIRRDYFMHLTLRFPENEWNSVARLIRHLQRAGTATFYPDQDLVIPAHTIYGHRPALGEEIRPRRTDEPDALEIDVTVRRTTPEIFTDQYFGLDRPIIADLEIELDARHLVGFSDGDTVTTWNDISGKGNDAVAPGGSFPKYRATGIGGGASVELTQDPMPLDDDSFLIGTDYTIFCVFSDREWDASVQAILGGDSQVNNNNLSILTNGSGGLVQLDQWNNAIVTGAGVLGDGTDHVIMCQHDGAVGKQIRVDGVQEGSGGDTTDLGASITGTALGQWNTGGEYMHGTPPNGPLLGQFSAFSRALEVDEIDDWEAYLATAFGITI